MTTTRRMVALVAAAVLAGCSGSSSPTGTTDPPTADLAVVSGDGQAIPAPEDTLPFPVVLKLTRGGQPLANQQVDCKVVEDNAGTCFQSSVTTASDGTVKDWVVAGTHAWTAPSIDGPAHFRFQYVDQQSGDRVVAAEGTYMVQPDVVDAVEPMGYGGPGPATLPWAKDRYGNPALARIVVSAADSMRRFATVCDSVAGDECVRQHRDTVTVATAPDAFSVRGTEPGSRAARTVDIADTSDSASHYAVLCMYAGTVGSDSLVAVAEASVSGGSHLEVGAPQWDIFHTTDADYPNGRPATYVLQPSDCVR